LSRSIAAARWRRSNTVPITALFSEILGKVEPAPAAQPVANWPLGARLHALRLVAERTAPIDTAIRMIDQMAREQTAMAQAEKEIDGAASAAEGLGRLVALRDIVNAEVQAVVTTLYQSTAEWKKRLYVAASTVAPSLSGASVGSSGEVLLEMQAAGTRVAAETVANASSLRAALVAFLFAFWEYCWKERGGLSLLLLDDLHELFDPENRRLIAQALPMLVAQGAHVICTSNDESFAREVDHSCVGKVPAGSFERRCVHPLSVCRQVVSLGYTVDEVDRKKEAFNRTQDDSAALEYLATMRTFLEDRLGAYFEQQEGIRISSFTVAALLNAARRERSAGIEPFALRACGALLDDPALQERSALIDLLNEAHHRGSSTIVAAHAIRVENDLARLRNKLDEATRERTHWLQRDPMLDGRRPHLYVLPSPMALPETVLPVRWELAAFTGDEMGAQLYDEELQPSWFENKAAYRIARHNFGFAGPRGSVAIVQLSTEDVMDNRLVIAMHESHIYARRLLRSRNREEYVALASEQEDPTKRARSETFLRRDVQLLKMVGVLFDSTPLTENVAAEAVPCDAGHLLAKAEVAYRVRGTSALPLALEKQWVLGGPTISPAALTTAAMKGTIVAVRTTTGAFLKRVGDLVVPDQQLLLLESIGGLGSSMVVSLDLFPPAGVSRLIGARTIVGVLYDK
jgi:hypothetical protein